MDIVEQLRDGICTYTSALYGSGNVDLIKTYNMLKKAAAEIERLRALTTWHRIDDPDNPPPKDTPIRIKVPFGYDRHDCVELLAISVRGERWFTFAYACGRDLPIEPTHWQHVEPQLPTPPEVK